MKKHELKILPQYFQAVWIGIKTFELRKDDRDYQQRYIEERNAAVELTGELAKMPSWIPVTERLPQGGDESGELCENVILLLSVCFNENYVTSGWINGVTKKAYYLDEKDDFIHKTDISNVKAWMQLSEPPKEDET